ncbi:MAG: STN domain-containing protein, partial [Flavobacteriales bacterium]|nr:STN domain-containing protein [Flavobacteriales bacterium]
MKLYPLILIIFLLLVQQSNAQNEVSVSGQFENTSLTEIFRKWKRENDLRFAFDAVECDKIHVTLDIDNKTISAALTEVLDNTKLQWKLVGNTYVIFPGPNQSSSVQPV